MFRAFADVQTAEMLDLPRPALEGGKPHRRRLPDVGEQAACKASWSSATSGCPQGARSIRGRTTPWRSPPTAASSPSTPGCSAAAGDFADSKINALVRNVVEASGRKPPTERGTQMVFCDMGVNPDGRSRPTTRIASKLAVHGIPAAQVAAIGDADTDAKKQALFEKVRQGSVRVLHRLDGQDGHRHQRPEAAGGPPPPRRPVEAGRGRAARGPHPPPGQHQRHGERSTATSPKDRSTPTCGRLWRPRHGSSPR